MTVIKSRKPQTLDFEFELIEAPVVEATPYEPLWRPAKDDGAFFDTELLRRMFKVKDDWVFQGKQ